MRGPNIPRLLRLSHILNVVLLTFARLRDSLISAHLIFSANLGLHII